MSCSAMRHSLLLSPLRGQYITGGRSGQPARLRRWRCRVGWKAHKSPPPGGAELALPERFLLWEMTGDLFHSYAGNPQPTHPMKMGRRALFPQLCWNCALYVNEKDRRKGTGLCSTTTLKLTLFLRLRWDFLRPEAPKVAQTPVSLLQLQRNAHRLRLSPAIQGRRVSVPQ